jgi:CRP/FNR family transcriptional regulator
MQPGTVFPLDTSLAYGSAFWGLEIYYRALTNATIYALPQSVYDRASRATSALKGQQLDVAIRAQSLLVERIVNLFINDVAKRLHLRLILLAEYVGDKKGDTAVLKLPLTHVDMAESIGTTRETINRLMTKMQNDGYISVHKRIITIISVSRLEDDYKHWKVPNKQ